MSKHASHGQRREGESSGADADPGTPEGEALSRREDPAPEAAANEAAGTQTTEPPRQEPLPEQKTAAPEAELAKKDAELAEVKDQLLRKAADFENFRKRMNRERQDAIDFANQSLLLDLIPILDDFDRALEAAGTSLEQAEGESAGAPGTDLKSFYQGVAMIAKRLSSTLETKWGLKSYAAAGEPFDPNRHEALMVEKSAEVTEQMVRQDLLKGYTLKERVIRSAKVKVLVPEPAAASGPGGEDAASSGGSGASGGAEEKIPNADFDSQNEIKQEKE